MKKPRPRSSACSAALACLAMSAAGAPGGADAPCPVPDPGSVDDAAWQRSAARETARLLTRVQPDYVGALTLMLVPGAPLCDAARAGSFILPSPFELVRELKVMIEESDLNHCLFFSNHASNYVPVQARLPRDKKACLQLLNAVLSQPDRAALTPEYLRAL